MRRRSRFTTADQRLPIPESALTQAQEQTILKQIKTIRGVNTALLQRYFFSYRFKIDFLFIAS